MAIPHYLKSGEVARLFPVLSTTSKEGRTTSVVLACMSKVDEFGQEMCSTLGRRVGKTTRIDTYTEVVFDEGAAAKGDRPDGLVVLRTGGREWRALVETKVGNSTLSSEQVERYRALAKRVGLDAVITISNQFTADAKLHPNEEVRKSKSKIPVFHWSWMSILTTCDLLLSNEEVADADQFTLLNELRRFLSHDSAGVRGFERMPPEWSELNKLVSAGGAPQVKSGIVVSSVEAWHQETRDLSLILSRATDSRVRQKLPRSFRNDVALRTKSDAKKLCEEFILSAEFDINDAVSSLKVIADVRRRSIDVGMDIKAPDDRVSTKARTNWLIRQLKTKLVDDVHVRLFWPGRAMATQFPLSTLQSDILVASSEREHLSVSSFHVLLSRRLGVRFTQQVNFISDLEMVVPLFYEEVGQHLRAWKRPPPRIRSETVDIEAIEAQANVASERLD